MNSELNTHNVRIDFGKHRGELFTRLPLGYLRWMVNENTQQAELARAELERRGGDLPQVEVSRHAIDRASLRVLHIWQQDRQEDEGLASWLERITLEAVKQAPTIGEKLHYKHMKLFVTQGEEFPVLKTIMRNKAHDEVEND